MKFPKWAVVNRKGQVIIRKLMMTQRMDFESREEEAATEQIGMWRKQGHLGEVLSHDPIHRLEIVLMGLKAVVSPTVNQKDLAGPSCHY